MSADPFVGCVLDARYRLTRRLGAGRFGAVYLADDETAGTVVAVKVLHRRLAADDAFAKAFRQLRPWGSPLPNNHQRLLGPRSYGVTETGDLFIVMEYTEGRPLGDVLAKERPMKLERALRLAIQIGEGLEAAHAMGFVHQSLSPRNVLVTTGDDDGIRLLGYELARCPETPTLLELARNGPAEYMAPEQVNGAEITEATDLYAFGVILYQMLSGSVPFSGSNRDAVLTKHLKYPPVAPRKLRHQIPGAVDRLIMQMLEKKPVNRPRDISVVVNELWKEEGRLHDGPQRLAVVRSLTSRLGSRRARTIAAAAILLMAAPPSWIMLSRRSGEQLPAPPAKPAVAGTRQANEKPTALPSPPADKQERPEPAPTSAAAVPAANRETSSFAPAPAAPAPVAPAKAADTPAALPAPTAGLSPRPGVTAKGVAETNATADVKRRIEAKPSVDPKAPTRAAAPTSDAPVRTATRPDPPTGAASRSPAAKPESEGRASAQPPAPARTETPRDADGPDPSGIIDWLLKERPGR